MNSEVEKNKTLYIVIPIYNEVHNVADLVDGIERNFANCTYEMLFSDDGSDDGTLDILRNLSSTNTRVQYISLSRNRGKEIALLAGIKSVPHDVSYIITMDGDGQHKPEEAKKLFDFAIKSEADVVFGVRKNRSYQSKKEKFLTNMFYLIVNRISSVSLDASVGDFNFLSGPAIHAVQSFNEQSVFLKGMYSWIGFQCEYFPVEIAERVHGESKFHFAKRLGLALNAITGHSVLPLRLAAAFGALIFSLALIGIVLIIIQYFVMGVVTPGYYSMLILNMAFFGLIMLFLGIIGEYLSHIHEQTQMRPLYFIKERNVTK